MLQKPVRNPSSPIDGAPRGQIATIADYESVLDLLACPACRQALVIIPNAVSCSGCGRVYPLVDGIPILLIDRAGEPK